MNSSCLKNLGSQYKCPLCLSEESFLFSVALMGEVTGRPYHRCLKCQLIFVPQEFHLNFDDEKKRYDQHQNDPQDKNYVKFLDKLITPLVKHLKAGDEGLDFGCGPGPAVSTILRKKGIKVFDYDPFYFPDESLLQRKYQFISCTEVAEHLRQPRDEFLLMDKLLDSNRAVLGLMTEVWDESGKFEEWWYQREISHISFYTQATLQWVAGWLSWEADFVGKNVVIFKKYAAS